MSAYVKENHIEDKNSPDKVLLLFSGGIDAQTSYILNIAKHPLLCNIQGWLQHDGDNSDAAEADKRDISRFAAEQKMNATFLQSNFAVVVNADHYQNKVGSKIGYNWWYGFQHSMAFISIAIPIAYYRGIDEILIASSYFIGSSSLCASYATTDIEFNFAGKGHTIHDGFELTRQDKVHIVVEHQRKSGKPYPIRVCSFNDHNCCECEKCFRTMLGIVAEGADVHDFDFNIKKPIKEHFIDVLQRKQAIMGFDHEAEAYWGDIKDRMRENYDRFSPEYKDFVDWFFTYDFVGQKKKALVGYYRKNFFSILKRKLGILK